MGDLFFVNDPALRLKLFDKPAQSLLDPHIARRLRWYGRATVLATVRLFAANEDLSKAEICDVKRLFPPVAEA